MTARRWRAVFGLVAVVVLGAAGAYGATATGADAAGHSAAGGWVAGAGHVLAALAPLAVAVAPAPALAATVLANAAIRERGAALLQHGWKSITGWFSGPGELLKERNYWPYAVGNFISRLAFWMATIAQDRLVLRLSHGNSVALSVVTILQFTPILFVTLFAGVWIDRLNKRGLVVILQAGLGVGAAALGLLTITGHISLPAVYGLALWVGVLTAVNRPAARALVAELVDKDLLGRASSLNATVNQLARVVGPAIAATLLDFAGPGWIFVINAVSFLAMIAALSVVKSTLIQKNEKKKDDKSVVQQLRNGLGYVRRDPTLRVMFFVVAVVFTFGINFTLTLPLLATNVFHAGGQGQGLLTTAIAVGSLVGAAWTTASREKPNAAAVLRSALLFGLLEAVAGQMPTLVTAAVVLAFLGVTEQRFTTMANTLIQKRTPKGMQGQFSALYTLASLGLNPVIAPVVGVIAAYSARAPLTGGGVVAALAAAAAVLVVPGTWDWIRQQAHTTLHPFNLDIPRAAIRVALEEADQWSRQAEASQRQQRTWSHAAAERAADANDYYAFYLRELAAQAGAEAGHARKRADRARASAQTLAAEFGPPITQPSATTATTRWPAAGGFGALGDVLPGEAVEFHGLLARLLEVARLPGVWLWPRGVRGPPVTLLDPVKAAAVLPEHLQDLPDRLDMFAG